LLGLTAVPVCAHAQQDISDDTIGLSKIGSQSGVVTEVSGHDAWVRFPHAVKVGEKVDFTFYGEGTKPLAQGKIDWVSPVKPYDCLIVGIKAVENHFLVNDNDDQWGVAVLFNKVQKVGEHDSKDAYGCPIAINMHVRANELNLPAMNADGVEPVHAFIAALRARKNKTAAEIADAAERAIVDESADQAEPEPTPEAAEHAKPTALPTLSVIPGPSNELVNYSVLAANLQRFKTLQGVDTVTAHIYHRLAIMARDHVPGAHLPVDLLNPKANAAQGPGGQ